MPKKSEKQAKQASADAASAATAPATIPAMPGAPGMMAMPGMQAMPGMAGMAPPPMAAMGFGAPQGNPMLAMMQMMQMMMGGGMPTSMVDPAAMPFAAPPAQSDGDKGLDAEIIRPATLTDLIRTQESISLGSVLDLLCLTEDGKNALGGIPKGCTMALAGPPGKGKTRTALAGLARVALSGVKVALVVAEEGFHDPEGSGRDDLCSRLVKIGMAATHLDEKKFVSKVLDNMRVLVAPYHKTQSWDEFVTRYRYLVEKEGIDFVVIDSLNTLDPTKTHTADNLSALKTYNHEKGITCICIGQIRDTGQPVGGEALQHTADAVFLIEEMTLGSKEIAEKWGGSYRDKIDIIQAVKSVTTPVFPHPIRVQREPTTGCLTVHGSQPDEYAVLPARG